MNPRSTIIKHNQLLWQNLCSADPCGRLFSVRDKPRSTIMGKIENMEVEPIFPSIPKEQKL